MTNMPVRTAPPGAGASSVELGTSPTDTERAAPPVRHRHEDEPTKIGAPPDPASGANPAAPIPLDPHPTPPGQQLAHGPKRAIDAPKVGVPPRLGRVTDEPTSVGLAPVFASPSAPSPSAPTAPPTRRCANCAATYPADFLVCPRDATPLMPLDGDGADPLVGTVVGDTYQIVRVVGEGGMGRVYEARHLRLKERRFAVKCLHADLARSHEMAARFLREAESASSIKHENVVDVFDVHHLPDGTPYLVGEFLEGEELADYVARRGPLEPHLAVKIARQVCDALAAAHVRGIVHRDMKPENIFVIGASIAAFERGESRSLRVKVLDFGISKAGPDDTSNLTRTGMIMGTPSYMAPEQARGRPVDHRADVYAVGACLYFMVTGRRPFDSDTPASTLSMVLIEDPARPREINPRVPEALEIVIQRAMAKDASDRYASMVDLEKALGSLSGRASVPGAPESRHRLGIHTPAEIEIGSAHPFDLARAVLGTGSFPALSPTSANLGRAVRPTIVLTSVVLGTWLVGGTVGALAGLVRVLHDGELTLTESLLLGVGCLFAAATPFGLYVVHLRRAIWPNSVRALQLAVDLRRMVLTALVTYGAFSILGRIGHTVFWRSSRGLASGAWDIALLVFSLVATLTIGGFVPFMRNLRRRRRA